MLFSRSLLAELTVLVLFVFSPCTDAVASNPRKSATIPSAGKINHVVSPLMKGVSGCLVLGFTNGVEHKFFCFGTTNSQSKEPPDENTIFEIGSITKVFTSLLMTDLWRENIVSFDDPVEKYLPKTVVVPKRNGKKITLFQLATHTSGMQRDPDNLRRFDKYGKDEFHKFLARCKLDSIPGSNYWYSNAGYRLLGEALEFATMTSYEDLLEKRVTDVLKIHATTISVPKERLTLMAQGHGKDGNDIQNMPDTGGPAGGLKSSANDLLVLLDAALTAGKSAGTSAINRDISEMCKRRFVINSNDSSCLAWMRNNGRDSYGKNGQIHGFSTYLAFSPSAKLGVVVLSSTLQLNAEQIFLRINNFKR